MLSLIVTAGQKNLPFTPEEKVQVAQCGGINGSSNNWLAPQAQGRSSQHDRMYVYACGLTIQISCTCAVLLVHLGAVAVTKN